MKSACFAALVATFAACSSPPSTSIPSLSGLTLTPTAAPGSSEIGTFQISNAAGFTGLTLELQLTDPGTSAPTSESAPLTISGVVGTTEAAGEVTLDLPMNATPGTYAVSVTVTDGTYASNTLTGSFVVN